MELQLGSIRF